jgi:putative toxin-antitoxin system antitoxin component (TIGR02293 family)
MAEYGDANREDSKAARPWAVSAYLRAVDVFGDPQKARAWFEGPKPALGDKTPLESCETEEGARDVTDLLGRIEHGVF